MTENTSIIRKGKESKLPVCVNEEKDINVTLKNKRSNVKKKEECNAARYYKKNMKAPMKQKNKFPKDTEKISISNMPLRYDKKMYEYQILQLDRIFKQSANCPILTRDELKMLFVKYKSDGHYRANKILPSFTSILDNSNNIINETKQFCDQMQYVPSFNTKETNTKTLDTFATPYYYIDKENLSACANTSSMDNKIDNKCLSIGQNPFNNNNNNQLFTNHDMEINSINILDGIPNFNQSRLDLNAKKNFSTEDYFSYNFMNTQNIPEEHHDCTNKNLLYNIFDSNSQYKNLSNNETLQQHDTRDIMQYDSQLNSEFWNDACSNKWSMHKNNNQYCKYAHSTVSPYTNDLKSCCNVNNSMTASQMTLIKNHLENGSNFNPSIHIHTNPFINSEKNVMYDFNDNIITQENFNPPSADSNMISDNFLAESNASTYANFVDQLM
ncbi:uncharacterized protein LOC105664352 [Megachile rotundata]|uniref:uncharacterized protein LOC105664352 n=1 Tax=Megachile rotundata TaxID=143995 RepID=UPI003FD0BA1B